MNSVTTTILPESVSVAIRNLEGELLRLRKGELTNDEFRPSRTRLGVYGQRQPEEHMVRVSIPGGCLTSSQLRCLAQIAREYGDGVSHVTTRQNIQLYQVKLDDVPEVLRKLAKVGLTTLNSGGNSVRNIVACPLAGVCAKESFDITPYVRKLGSHWLGNGSSTSLPRKFKTSFSGCALDCAYTAIQDFGAIAQVRTEDGAVRRGFRIFVGGGLGVYPKLAEPLEDFTPEEELLLTWEAVIRVFDRLGDRKKKQKARLKFVLDRLGASEFRRLVYKERESLRVNTASPAIVVSNKTTDVNGSRADSSLEQLIDEYNQGSHQRSSESQGRGGRDAVVIPLKLGDITPTQMDAVADLADQHCEGELRTSLQQDLVLRSVPSTAFPAVYEALDTAGIAGTRTSGICNITSCPGTSVCSLGITSSRGLSSELARMLEEKHYGDDEALGKLRIKVSGCPDACGQHHLADIGLYGCALRSESRLYPAYQLLVGGEVTEEGTRLARPVMKIPARAVPEAVARLIEHYRSQRGDSETFSEFVDRIGLESLRGLLEDLTDVPSPREDIWSYIDWDSTLMYVLRRGEGECSI